jgi:hypothetical protein
MVDPGSQGSGAEPAHTDGQARALALLAGTREAQDGLPAAAALAWERTAFRAAFLDAEPGRRIRAFLSGQRRED